ncbi:MAG: hypothetical protein JNL21_23095 [Myxococcales bacterium]|nr:hypothetical protein [Myxococcales bacterium]
MMQEIAAALTVALAASYLAYKLVIEPTLRRTRPDVPLGRLRRKPPPKRDCCD